MLCVDRFYFLILFKIIVLNEENEDDDVQESEETSEATYGASEAGGEERADYYQLLTELHKDKAVTTAFADDTEVEDVTPKSQDRRKTNVSDETTVDEKDQGQRDEVASVAAGIPRSESDLEIHNFINYSIRGSDIISITY